ncbi:MAG: TIGR03936 family radical SAM-associated protein [Clostridia bacterium]|nr:TIGR03936 family radical SAM-associated protein [Clostridia bacterium]
MVSLITPVRPADAVHNTLRLRFEKRGALAYISHLDLFRTVNKALHRAALPLYYSEGFSPHPKLVFATPLSLGQESVCEYLDVRLSEDVSATEAMAALNATLPAGLRITAAGYPALKFTAIARSVFEITLVTAGADEALASRCAALLRARPLVVFKRSKAGDRDTDISGSILDVFGEYRDGAIRLTVTLVAENSAFLNPEYLVSVLRRDAGVLSTDPTSESCRIVRLALTDADGDPFTEEM